MKILVITNRYPPYYTGGYELNCQEVVAGLHRAGHRVRVLTSAWGVGKPLVERTELNTNPLEIFRTLTPCFDFWLKRHQLFFSWVSLQLDKCAADAVLQDFWPDLIYVWNMDWSSIAALSRLQAVGKPMVYHFGAPWFNTYAERATQLRSGPLFRFYRQVSGQTWGWDYRRLRIDTAICMTAFIRQQLASAGWIAPESEIIPHGFDLTAWPYQLPLLQTGSILHLLYVGRLDPLKGIATIVAALPAIRQLYPGVSLTISSPTSDSLQSSAIAYRHQLETQAQLLGVVQSIKFVHTPREKLPSLYAASHLLIFPSLWQEPYGLIPLEAMACGTPVLATGTGGSSEYLRDGENSLLYPPGDIAGLASCIQKLASDPGLRATLSQQGRKLVEQDFQLKTTLERIETFLELVNQKRLSQRKGLRL